MRPGPLCLAFAAWLALANPAAAVPIKVIARLDLGAVPPATPVVAFSYDVRRVFPAIANRYALTRPVAPHANVKPLPLLPSWHDYAMIQARQLAEFRESFRRAHHDEKALLDHLMPKFDKVYQKHGNEAPNGGTVDSLAPENPRRVWCEKVTHELNAILETYNAYGLSADPAPDKAYERQLAGWRIERNMALHEAARRVGANEAINYMEGETNERGMATFDLPPGTWYIACQSDGKSWYKAVRIGNRGGSVVLTTAEADGVKLDLSSWTGQ